MANTITSADINAHITVDALYPMGFVLEGFSADNIFEMDNLELAQAIRGADGKLSAGFVFGTQHQTFHIMPDSPVYKKIQTWATTSVTSKGVYRCNLTAVFKTNGTKFVCTNGVLLNAGNVANAARMLQPITFQIAWETVTPSEYS